MTVFSLVFAVAAIIYAALAVIVILRNPGAILNWFCGLLLTVFAVWTSGCIFHHLQPLIPYSQAHLANRVVMTGAYTFASAWLLFALALTNRQGYLRAWPIYVPIIGIPLALLIHEWFGPGVGTVVQARFYWGLKWQTSFWSALIVVYESVASLLGLYLVARFGRHATRKRQRRQALVTVCTASATWLFGSITDIGWPIVTHNPLPEIAAVLGLFWAVGLALTLTRYGLISFTVQAAADRVLATMPDVLLLLDNEGNILTANEALFDILGYGRQELRGYSAARLFDQPGDFEPFRDRLQREHHLPGVEATARHRDGRKVPISINARTMPRGDGSARGSVWVLRDITAQKQAAEEIRAKTERLELVNQDLDRERRNLLALTDQLSRANADLKRLSDAKSEFVAAASHDLRTPLTTIIEGVNLVEDGSLGSINDEQKKYLRMAREDALRLAEMIGSVLDVAKIEQGKITLRKARVDIAEVFERVGVTYGSYARDKGLHFAAELSCELLAVYCDPGHYHRVLANLVSNAIKFTPEGGSILVRASRDHPQIAHACSPVVSVPSSVSLPQPMIVTSVRDSGVGIPQDQQHRIFQKFEQIAQTGTVVQSGTGLGLALCKQLVELNGGTIGFESDEGKGSTFFFALPEHKLDCNHG